MRNRSGLRSQFILPPVPPFSFEAEDGCRTELGNNSTTSSDHFSIVEKRHFRPAKLKQYSHLSIEEDNCSVNLERMELEINEYDIPDSISVAPHRHYTREDGYPDHLTSQDAMDDNISTFSSKLFKLDEDFPY